MRDIVIRMLAKTWMEGYHTKYTAEDAYERGLIHYSKVSDYDLLYELLQEARNEGLDYA